MLVRNHPPCSRRSPSQAGKCSRSQSLTLNSLYLVFKEPTQIPDGHQLATAVSRPCHPGEAKYRAGCSGCQPPFLRRPDVRRPPRGSPALSRSRSHHPISRCASRTTDRAAQLFQPNHPGAVKPLGLIPRERGTAPRPPSRPHAGGFNRALREVIPGWLRSEEEARIIRCRADERRPPMGKPNEPIELVCTRT